MRNDNLTPHEQDKTRGVIAALLAVAWTLKSKEEDLELTDVMRYFVRFYGLLSTGFQSFQEPRRKKSKGAQ